MLFFHYGIQERAAIGLICCAITALFGPRFDQIPVCLEKLVLAGALEESRFEFCDNSKPAQIMGIGVGDSFLVWEVIAPGLLRNVGLEGALHDIPREVKRSVVVPGAEKNLCLPKACAAQALKVLPIHPVSVGNRNRGLREKSGGERLLPVPENGSEGDETADGRPAALPGAGVSGDFL